MNKDYLKGIIDATIELNKLAGIESDTIVFSTGMYLLDTHLLATWNSGVKIHAVASYWEPEDNEIVFNSQKIKITNKTTVLEIVNFVSECTEQAMKDEYNNL